MINWPLSFKLLLNRSRLAAGTILIEVINGRIIINRVASSAGGLRLQYEYRSQAVLFVREDVCKFILILIYFL